MAEGKGGGIYGRELGEVYIGKNCSFEYNKARGSGGAIYMENIRDKI